MAERYTLGDAVIDLWIVILTIALFITLYRGFQARKPGETWYRTRPMTVALSCLITIIVLLIVRFVL